MHRECIGTRKNIAQRGMECATADKKQILLHPIVASYVGDPPECGAFLG